MKKYYVSFECGETDNTYWDGLYLRKAFRYYISDGDIVKDEWNYWKE